MNSNQIKYLESFHHQIYGEPSSPKLVFLHGLMGFGANWRRIVSSLEAKFNILTFDQRGHGRSMKPEHGYAPEDYANDLLNILDELGWEKIHLVGHSMGGRNAMNFAFRFPRRVISLVIEDIGPESDPSDVGRYEKLIGRVPTPFATKLQAKQFLLNDFGDAVLGNYFYSNLVEKQDGSVDWRFSKNAIFESVKMGRNQDRWHEFEAIRVPSLIVRGENSKDLSKETFQKMIEKNSHMESVEIPGSGHWVHFDKPDEFIRVIDEFLTKTALKR